MAMQTLYLKEHDVIVHDPTGQLASSVPTSQPWWSALGSQPSIYGESCGQLKPLVMMEHHPYDGGQVTCSKQVGRVGEQGLNKGNPSQFTIFPGDGQKPQAVVSLQSAPSEQHGRFELGFGQSMVCAAYPYMDQCYGVFSTYGPPISGRVMLPLNLEDGPIYVNAKQYNGIIRRRQSRAKAVLENKLTKYRKPYMHHSRHLHAMRRPRGCGGRFLNTKSSNGGKDGTEKKKSGYKGQVFLHPTGTQNSEVLQSDSRTLNSSKEAIGGGSALSGSEVTSMYSREELEHKFPISHLGLFFHSFPVMMENGRGSIISNRWVASADHCMQPESLIPRD